MTAAIASTRLVIGMEIHVELATRSKMFSRSANTAHPDFYDAAPNTLVDPVVAGLPGALPVMNGQAVELAVMVGMALGCTIATFSKWDRKNYFYPDLPKGYQISQYDLPLCTDGALEIPAETGGTKRIRVIRAHLEEDTGKLGHELPGGGHYDGSLVDLNRAGTPLLEIVTHPDLAGPGEAVTFARELRSICRFLGASEAIMQRGHIRFEPNVNVVITLEGGEEVATPIVEVKNLNSFRAIHDAIAYEHERQIEAWRAGGEVRAPGNKSTRGWDDDRRATVLQREKEEAQDYRYFPDPDLVPVIIDEQRREAIRARIGELPMERRARYAATWKLSVEDAEALTEERDLCLYFERCVAETTGTLDEPAAAQAVAKLLLNAGAKRANERDCGIHELGVAPEQVAGLIAMREAGEIGSSAADELFGLLGETDETPAEVARANRLLQVRDEGQLEQWCAEAIAAHPQAVADLKSGKQAAIGRLVGQVMKSSKGQADAAAARAMLQRLIADPPPGP